MDSFTDNGGLGSGNHQPLPQAPPRCARGCGFFGTAENEGHCSKCYMNFLKEKTPKSSSEAEIIRSDRDIILPEAENRRTEINNDGYISVPSIPKAKNRCESCSKKVGLLGFQCRCGGTFCGLHRYAEEHRCKFDFKQAGKIKIEKENPVWEADKIRDWI